ncbi:hypothetical protein BKA70DRAFT_1246443 [Coprinopsis sp. MPI-PUGE-AT-0042]|nr:hypothetical protein BKA70DRAFT_1246443 [Coprinopsis sp. MPI-PUGE-AT-0042]
MQLCYSNQPTPLLEHRHFMRINYEEMKPHLLRHGKNHFITMQFDDWFDNSFLNASDPRWSKKRAVDIKEHFRNGPDAITGDSGYTEFNRLVASTGENEAYAQFVAYSGIIADAANALSEENLTRTTKYESSGETSGKVEVMAPGYKPDGRFTLTEVTPRFSPREQRHGTAAEYHEGGSVRFANANCAAVTEFKKSDGPADRAQNEEQVVAGAYMLAFNDPRRTHVYALSMEKHSTRLWCFDRAAIRASPRFDCNEFPEYLIRFFLYMTFADKRQLGFDPTVQRRIVTDELSVYIYKCGQGYYRTVGPPISEDDALFLTSRGVRTWKVKKCDKDGIDEAGGSFRVLKDFWLYVDRPSESKIRAQVYENEALNDMERAVLRSLMTEIIEDEIVSVEVGGVPVDAQTLPVGLPETYDFDDFLSPIPKEPLPRVIRSSRSDSVDMVAAAAPPRYKVKLTPRCHRRMLTKELCIPLYTMCDPFPRDSPPAKLRDFFQVAADLSTGLRLFKKAAFMHRDISGGNCMAYWDPDRAKWMAKLHDCEYGKTYNSMSASDPITGTVIFSPVETKLRTFAYAPPQEPDLPEAQYDDDVAALYNDGSANLDKTPRSSPSSLDDTPANCDATRDSVPDAAKPFNDSLEAERNPFHYHPYYDLEALFWVVIWVILNYLMVTNPSVTLQGSFLEDWRERSLQIFNAKDFAERTALFERPKAMDNLIATLRRWGWSDAVMTICHPVMHFRSTLFQTYVELQSQPLDDGACWKLDKFKNGPYMAFRGRCRTASQQLTKLEAAGSTIHLTYVARILKKHQEEQKKAKVKAKEAKEKEKAERKSNQGEPAK